MFPTYVCIFPVILVGMGIVFREKLNKWHYFCTDPIFDELFKTLSPYFVCSVQIQCKVCQPPTPFPLPVCSTHVALSLPFIYFCILPNFLHIYIFFFFPIIPHCFFPQLHFSHPFPPPFYLFVVFSSHPSGYRSAE